MYLIPKIYCRIYQTAFRAVLPVLPYRNPKILNHLEAIPGVLKTKGCQHPLLVTDKNVMTLGLADPLLRACKKRGIPVSVFDEVKPNPTTGLVEQALEQYRSEGCDSLIALGGGSPMDCAKAVGARLARPRKSLAQMEGILRVMRKLPLLIAIPTTAGTGSETTLAAVITDSETRHKYAINDFPLIPAYAVLDPTVIHTLPAGVAASTGMDALTHAVEAYIGRSTTRQTREDAEKAVNLIFANIHGAVTHESTEAEKAMLDAAHYAGRAFTRSYVGYIHAVSHSLSGKYDMPHGLTNAILLPMVLEKYGRVIYKKLARLAICAGIGEAKEGKEVLARRFIQAIKDLNRDFGIPEKISGIQAADVPQLAGYAHHEANPLYPVPVLWNKKELETIYYEVMEEAVWNSEKSTSWCKSRESILAQE
jgi:alcohol dehydrogenase class IV